MAVPRHGRRPRTGRPTTESPIELPVRSRSRSRRRPRRHRTRCVEPSCTSVSLERSRSGSMVDDSFHAVVADHLERAGPIHAGAAAAALGARGASGHGGARVRRGCTSASPTLARNRPPGAGTCCPVCWSRRARHCSSRASSSTLGRGSRPPRDSPGTSTIPNCSPERCSASARVPVAWEVPIASNEMATLVEDALDRLPDGATALRSMLLARLSVAAATPETMATRPSPCAPRHSSWHSGRPTLPYRAGPRRDQRCHMAAGVTR